MSKRAVEKKGQKLRMLELLIIFFLPFLVIAANICGVAELVKIAKAKGYYTDGAGPSGSSAFSARRSWSA